MNNTVYIRSQKQWKERFIKAVNQGVPIDKVEVDNCYITSKSKRDKLFKYFSSKNEVNPSVILNSSNAKTCYIWICEECGEEFYGVLETIIKRPLILCNHCMSRGDIFRKNFVSLASFPNTLWKFLAAGNTEDPAKISAHSKNKYWFKCDCLGKEREHLIYTSVRSMVSAEKRGLENCTVNAGYVVIAGVNDFESYYPEASYYYAKSNMTKLSEVFYKSASYAEWVCPRCGNIYSDRFSNIVKRLKSGNMNCFGCNDTKCVPGVNDFITRSGKLGRMWDFHRNRGVDPTRYTGKSDHHYRWFVNKQGLHFLVKPFDIVHGKVTFGNYLQYYDKMISSGRYDKIAEWRKYNPEK